MSPKRVGLLQAPLNVRASPPEAPLNVRIKGGRGWGGYLSPALPALLLLHTSSTSHPSHPNHSISYSNR